jgi:2,3-bisphosphoglycerate-dependent phosphoglycerate mutase
MSRYHWSVPSTTLSPLVVVRHGESTWNELRLVQGQNDEARLTERGRQQAYDVARTFEASDFDLIVSSDLRRAAETAEALAGVLNIELEIDASLRERDFGVAEGVPLDDLPASLAGISDGVVTDDTVSPKGGETLRVFRERAERFLEARQRRWPTQRLLVVTHGGMIRALRRCYEGTPFQGSAWERVDNCAVMTLTASRS